jgi:hypothetical protein
MPLLSFANDGVAAYDLQTAKRQKVAWRTPVPEQMRRRPRGDCRNLGKRSTNQPQAPRHAGVRVFEMTEPESSIVVGDTTDIHWPYLRFEFGKTARSKCAARDVSWIDRTDKVIWRTALPERMQKLAWGDCHDRVEPYRAQPQALRYLNWHVLDVIELDDTIVVADTTGILALEKSSGRLLSDLPVPNQGRPLVFFDSGHFALTGEVVCNGKTWPRARVFHRCGEHIIYFNGRRAVLLGTTPLRIEAEGAFLGQRKHLRDGTGSVLQVGKNELILTGSIDRDW